MKSKTDRKRKKLLTGGLVLVLVAIVAGVFYFLRPDSKPIAVTERQATINYGPATETEKNEAEANKDRIIKENQASQTAPPAGQDKKSVEPVITNTSGSINAYIPSIFEEGGTCTATFTNDGTSLSKASVGFQNVSYTQCAPIELPAGLSSGTWSVVVTYTSVSAEGTSVKQSFKVN